MGIPLLADAGVLGLVLVAAGGLGLLVAVVALLRVAQRDAGALAAGVVAASLGVACIGLGAVGTLYGRVSTDAAISGDRPAERQRQRRDGYLLARAPSKLGILAGAVPLLAGVAAMFAGARRRARLAGPPDPELAPRPRLGLPIAVTLAGLASSGIALAALDDPVPGRNQRADVTARALLDRLDDVERARDGDDLVERCFVLEEEVVRHRSTLDRGLLPRWPDMARRCVEARIQKAALLSSIGRVQSEMEQVARSPLLEQDAALQRLVASTLAEVRDIAVAPVDVDALVR